MNEFLNPQSMTVSGVDVFCWKPQDDNVTRRLSEEWTDRGRASPGCKLTEIPPGTAGATASV